jgi:hypothetical protein
MGKFLKNLCLTCSGLPNFRHVTNYQQKTSHSAVRFLIADPRVNRRDEAKPGEMPCPSAINGLHLREAAIHKQFRSRDVAAVVGCEKHHGLGDLIRCTHPAERNAVGRHRQGLFARSCGTGCFQRLPRSYQLIQSRRLDKAWAYRVYANAAIL